MVTSKYRFEDFIAAVKGMSPDEVVQDAETEARSIQGSARTLNTILRNERLEYCRKLMALCFFIRRGMKPVGLETEDLMLVRSLFERWANRKELPTVVLVHFKNLPAQKEPPVECCA